MSQESGNQKKDEQTALKIPSKIVAYVCGVSDTSVRVNKTYNTPAGKRYKKIEDQIRTSIEEIKNQQS